MLKEENFPLQSNLFSFSFLTVRYYINQLIQAVASESDLIIEYSVRSTFIVLSHPFKPFKLFYAERNFAFFFLTEKKKQQQKLLRIFFNSKPFPTLLSLQSQRFSTFQIKSSLTLHE